MLRLLSSANPLPHRRLPVPTLLHHIRNLSTTARTTPSAQSQNRWQYLKQKRRQTPPPSNRTSHQIDLRNTYPLSEALSNIRRAAWADFDESLELIFRLNIDPRKAPENIRGTVQLPHGTGRHTKIAVFAEGEQAKHASEAGADLVGADELVDRIKGDKAKCLKGFYASVAVPELLPRIASRVGSLLGPKRLMPAERDGTVGGEVGRIVHRLKNGLVKFRTDRDGNVQMIVGKLSFGDEELLQNVCVATKAIIDARPATVKKRYLQKAFVGSTMGPAMQLDLKELVRLVNQRV